MVIIALAVAHPYECSQCHLKRPPSIVAIKVTEKYEEVRWQPQTFQWLVWDALMLGVAAENLQNETQEDNLQNAFVSLYFVL